MNVLQATTKVVESCLSIKASFRRALTTRLCAVRGHITSARMSVPSPNI